MTSNEILFLLFSICQLVCILIPVINKKKEIDEKKHYNFGDYSLIILSTIAFGFSFFIFLSTQEDDKSKAILASNYQKELSNKLAERDSIHEYKDSILTIYYGNKVDSSYSKSIVASNEALAKYNLVLIDSMNRVTTKINIKSINLPQLSLEANSAEGSPIYITEIDKEKYLGIKLKSINNISYNLNINMCVLNITQFINDSLILFKFITSEQLDDRYFLSPEIVATIKNKVRNEWVNLEHSIILFYGEFSSDMENKNKRKYLQAYEFNFVKNILGSQIIGATLKQITETLKAKKHIN